VARQVRRQVQGQVRRRVMPNRQAVRPAVVRRRDIDACRLQIVHRALKDSVRRRTCEWPMRSLISQGSGSIREAIGMGPCTDELKLVALDKDDIEVISAHVQDSLVKVADILWRPSEHRFVIALNRFDWMSAAEIAKAGTVFGTATGTAAKPDYRRCRTALRFERVLACKCRNLDQTAKDAQLNLLAVEFAETDSPAGIVSLIFSGGGVIRLDVECLEAELADLGEVSTAAICPDHFAAGTARA
jgi:DUF2948 family protein